ncbi:MAG: MFS transporter [Candidatus Phaeomarinobacter sp.]
MSFWRSPLAILFLALMTVGISRSMLFAVLPPIARELGLTEVLVGLMFAAAAGTFAITSPYWGRMADRLGRVRVIAMGLVGFGVFMMLFTIAVAVGLAYALPLWAIFLLMFVPRVASAGASAAVMPGAQAYVADTTSARDRTSGTSLVAAAMGFGLISGPGIAGLMSGYELLAPMYLAAAIGIIGGVMAWWFLPEPARTQAQTDKPRPTLTIRDRRIVAMMPISMAISMMVAVTQQTSAFYFQDLLGLDAAGTARATGAALMMMAGATLFVQTAIVQRFRLTPPVLIYGGLILAVAAYVVLNMAGSFWMLTTGLVMVGIAFGMANPGISAAISLSVTANEQGSAAGLNASMSATGFMIGSLVGPGGYTLSPDLPHYFGLVALTVILIGALFVRFPNPNKIPPIDPPDSQA